MPKKKWNKPTLTELRNWKEVVLKVISAENPNVKTVETHDILFVYSGDLAEESGWALFYIDGEYLIGMFKSTILRDKVAHGAFLNRAVHYSKEPHSFNLQVKLI